MTSENPPLISPPLISIVVPVYNVAELVPDCIASVLAQTYPHFELILVDDGSTDGSGAVIDRFAAQDQRVHALHIANGGPSRARNVGIRASKGEFILFVDSDDTIRADALEVLVRCQQASGADMAIASYCKVFDGTRQVPDDGGITEDTVFDDASLYQYVREYIKKPHIATILVHCWDRLFRADILRDKIQFNEEFNQLEDADLVFRFLLETTKVAYTAERLYFHAIRTQTGANLTARMGSEAGALDKFFQAYEPIERYLKERMPPGVAIDAAQEMGHLYVTTTIIALLRVCRVVDRNNLFPILSKVKEIIKHPVLRGNLRHYRPEKGDSKSIYWALLLNSPLLALTASHLRARMIAYRRRVALKRLPT